ncbi:MAG: septal ring lytic transglycosylase RlpA family protein [Azoarcus sp.]|jgi:rare lipoprotein A|nr:septal ring lytic transglycosylase RlpA family protein [Azoarcus sp.]
MLRSVPAALRRIRSCRSAGGVGGAACSRLGLILAAGVLLAACGGPQVRPGGDGTRATAGTSTKGGGYYKDDGPGDAPPDLAAIPDAVPRAEPLHSRANRPYRVMGQNFVPHTRVEPYKMRGVASWYGRRFHGLATSSGEPYDMYAMTAAHPTLPIPSYARVTHLASGRSVVVRVNDRGPFLHGRIMDLSYTAAWKLGYVGHGSAEVEVEQILPGEPVGPVANPVASRDTTRDAARDTTIPDDPLAELLATVMAETATATENAVPAPAVDTLFASPAAIAGDEEQRIFLQLGVFSARENAENLRARVAAEMTDFAWRLALVTEGGYVRVYAGPYASMAEARAAAEQVGEVLGIQPFAVRRESLEPMKIF